MATITRIINDDDEFMTPAEVAQYFRVDPKTVTRWAKAGRLSCTRTLGGHRRFYRAEVIALKAALHQDRTQ